MPYHDNAALEAALQSLAEAAGDRVRVRDLGLSVEGRPLRSLWIAAPGRRPDAARPQAWVLANLHGNEVIGSELALALAEDLCAPQPSTAAAAVLAAGDVCVLPAANPDGRARAAQALSEGDWLRRAARANAHGVDLNRNFPRVEGAEPVWHPLAGSDQRWLPWYRGPAAASEPEVQAICAAAEELRPRVALNLHSVGELFLYPWCCRAQPPAALAAFLAMGEAFRAAQPAEPYRVKQSRAWYTILGDLDDWLHDRFGTLSVTVELARPLAGLAGRPWRMASSLAWMNPTEPAAVVAATALPCLRALRTGLESFLSSSSEGTH